MPRAPKKLLAYLRAPWKVLARRAEEPWYPPLRDALLALAIAALGAMGAAVILEPWREPAEPLASVSIGGLRVGTGDPRPDALVELARDRLQAEILLKGPGLEHRTTWARLGAGVDMETLGRLLVELARADSPAARYNREEAARPGEATLSLPVSLKSDAAVEALVTLKHLIDRKAVNARFDFASSSVSQEQPGRSMDVYATLKVLDAAMKSGVEEVDLVVVEVPAAVTMRDLQDIDAATVAGFYETPYSRMSKDQDRTHNVALGASMLDGQVILPGQRFSFNETLGDRSEARGFRYAPVIAGGAIVEGMGGGTCQVASTLYAAAFFAGLVIEERQPHSRPSSYIKLGLDATVSYPDLDLKLRNPFTYPVVIHYTVRDGVARVEIRAGERPFTVTLLRKVVDTRPFPVRVVEDAKLARGREVITQLGVPGYTVLRHKLIERDKVAYRFQSVDKYPPTVQFVHKGTADPASLKGVTDGPKPDTHKPYHASASLRMVQGPGGLWYESTHD